MTEVLNYVSFNRDDLVAKLRKLAEAALRAGRLTLDESRHLLRVYENGLSGYTYLERDVDAKLASAQLRLVPVAEARPAKSAPTGT